MQHRHIFKSLLLWTVELHSVFHEYEIHSVKTKTDCPVLSEIRTNTLYSQLQAEWSSIEQCDHFLYCTLFVSNLRVFQVSRNVFVGSKASVANLRPHQTLNNHVDTFFRKQNSVMITRQPHRQQQLFLYNPHVLI